MLLLLLVLVLLLVAARRAARRHVRQGGRARGGADERAAQHRGNDGRVKHKVVGAAKAWRQVLGGDEVVERLLVADQRELVSLPRVHKGPHEPHGHPSHVVDRVKVDWAAASGVVVSQHQQHEPHVPRVPVLPKRVAGAVDEHRKLLHARRHRPQRLVRHEGSGPHRRLQVAALGIERRGPHDDDGPPLAVDAPHVHLAFRQLLGRRLRQAPRGGMAGAPGNVRVNLLEHSVEPTLARVPPHAPVLQVPHELPLVIHQRVRWPQRGPQLGQRAGEIIHARRRSPVDWAARAGGVAGPIGAVVAPLSRANRPVAPRSSPPAAGDGGGRRVGTPPREPRGRRRLPRDEHPASHTGRGESSIACGGCSVSP